MIDVDEIYKVPNHKTQKDAVGEDELAKEMKNTNLNEEKDTNEADNKRQLSSSAKNAIIPKKDALDVNVESILNELNLYKSGRFNVFERHVNQMFIRGDNVVMITLTD